ncbi:hypothetical protein [Promicromonospora soli]|uniref:Uncharacterized protein n=1 Tax=Promicromonospora soli TaxID=2035533 RepID=A0A919FYI7_9MICO|nr:hypothetical protein [Promicromonospora soli]GHH74887.1 hypothetical protein GCM10017772_29880 [Promicromonospora soli]
MTFGPFAVEPASISALGGANFTPFVNRLLATEIAAHGIAGAALETTYRDNLADGGVDAGLRSSIATRWVPQGESAWQFKAGDLAPSKCRDELKGAVKALETLKGGGKYRLVLGKSLTPQMIGRRRGALIATATELGIALTDDSIEVLTADTLAQWVEEYPALAVNRLLGSIGRLGQTFDEWSSSNQHMTQWTTSERRSLEIAGIRNFIEGSGLPPDIHVEGFSGLGKTRLVLEALRGQPYESLVVYAPAADSFQPLNLGDLQHQRRTAIVVLDECDAKAHDIYASVLPANTSLRLITIGEPSGRSTRSPMLGIHGLEDEAMNELLRANQPSLWPEAVRVVTEVAAGNVDYAFRASRALTEHETTSAKELITANDVRSFLASQLPDGALFLGCCALALFSRLGFDGEVASELAVVAQGLNIDERDLRSAAIALDQRGLLSQQGRYRSVGPHPVALYLADRGWAEFGGAIVRDLLPTLDGDLTERLFRRATEIGDPNVVRAAVAHLLTPHGPLGTWERLGYGGNGRLLTHVAVLAPGTVTDHLISLVGGTSDGDLLAMRGIRRDLVWTLEKLAWHSATFVASADLLLRLAVNENEDYANNSSGTWVGLFGTMLPGTATDPETRMQYLRRTADSADPRVRRLVVRAADHALDTHETIAVSGELQGGAIVAPRGMPATYSDAWQYRNEAIDLLRRLSDDQDPETSAPALKALINCIHASLEIEANRRHLGDVFATLDSSRLRVVRGEIADLEALFDRTDVQDGRAPAVQELRAALPRETDADKLWTLAHTHSWDRQADVLPRDLSTLVNRLGENGPPALLQLLQEPSLPAAHQVGRLLAELASDSDRYLIDLSTVSTGSIGEAAIGYLWAKVEGGHEDAFDSFIDGLDLPPITALDLTARGPATDRAWERAVSLLPSLSVRDGAVRLFRWLRELDQTLISELVDAWMARMSSQADYNAVVDLVALYLHGREVVDGPLRATVDRLAAERRQFPQLGQQSWDWAQLARRQLMSNPSALVELLIDLVDGDALRIYEGSEEMKLLQQAIAAAGPDAWAGIMGRIVDGAWRVGFTARGWLAAAVDLDVAKLWVGEDADRARTLAWTAPVGGAELPEVVRYLLEKFGEDDEVAAALAGQFTSGFWTGPESDRVKSQIEQVKKWANRRGEASPVIEWTRRLLEHLNARLRTVEQREAEERS